MAKLPEQSQERSTEEITLSIFRYTPGKKGWYQDFKVDLPKNYTVLDSLMHIKDNVDGSLTFRKNCRNAICGSCAVRVNGQAVLACKDNVHDLKKRYGGKLRIGPMGNMPVIKDLVTDMDAFWEQFRAVRPYLMSGKLPEREFKVMPEERDLLTQMADCIQCGACYSDCNSVEIEPKFVGPAALAKAFRFVADSRDTSTKERLELYEKPHGHWDCTHCFVCIEVCPMGVAPMDQILKMRKLAMDSGFKSAGQRHHDAFVDSVRTSGWLNELSIPFKSKGFDIIGQLQLIPVGLRMITHDKMPHIFHKKIEKADEVKNVMDRSKNVDEEGVR